MGELAEFIGVDRTTITRTVDQLVATGLVERHTPASDRRQVELSATETGKLTLSQARPIVFNLNMRVLEGVSDQVQRTVIRAEQRMFANLAVDPRAIERMLGFRRPPGDGQPPLSGGRATNAASPNVRFALERSGRR
jgi:DNA-binding IclR family transcriptional regulator